MPVIIDALTVFTTKEAVGKWSRSVSAKHERRFGFGLLRLGDIYGAMLGRDLVHRGHERH